MVDTCHGFDERFVLSRNLCRHHAPQRCQQAAACRSGPAMNDGQVHTIGSLDTFLNPEDHKAIAERIARSRQTAGVEVTSRDYSKTSNFVPRRMRKTRPVL